MAVLERNSKGQEFPVVKKQVVSCPLMAEFDTIVDMNYCVKKCGFYSKVIEDNTGSSLGYIECNFPRKIKIYPVAE
jgi:hypothetical protein